MSIRLAFFNVGNFTDAAMRGISAGIATERFAPESSSGFLLNEQSSLSVSGKYIQRLPTVQTVTDPFGKTTEYTFVQFLQQEFVISKRPSCIIYTNPCSASKPLTGRLLEFCDFAVAIEPVQFNLDNIINNFAQQFESVDVYSGIIDSLAISNNTNVRLQVDSSGNLDRETKQFLKPRKFKFASVKLKFAFAGCERRCEIKQAGSVTIFGEYDPVLRSKVVDLIKPAINSR